MPKQYWVFQDYQYNNDELPRVDFVLTIEDGKIDFLHRDPESIKELRESMKRSVEIFGKEAESTIEGFTRGKYSYTNIIEVTEEEATEAVKRTRTREEAYADSLRRRGVTANDGERSNRGADGADESGSGEDIEDTGL